METGEHQGVQHAEPDRTRWIGLVYYYLATAVGLAIMLAGVIGTLQGLVTAALPRISSEARFADVEAPKPDGVQLTEAERSERRREAIERARLGGWDQALRGAVTTVVGAPVFVWHLRQARRKDRPSPAARRDGEAA
jgi:ABC-type cobalamin transport system permease subunit